MGLAYAWWAKKDDVFPILQEAHGGQLINLALIDGGLEGEIKVVQGLLDGKTRHLDLLLIGSFSLGFRFFCKDVVQNERADKDV